MIYRDKVEELIMKHDKMQTSLDMLKSCPLEQESFRSALAQIQDLVDELNLASYSNLETWVRGLDKEIEAILLARLNEALMSWTDAFSGGTPNTSEETDLQVSGRANSRRRRRGKENEEAEMPDGKHSSRPVIQVSLHEIVIRNQVMSLNPPLQCARESWLQQLGLWLGALCDLEFTKFRLCLLSCPLTSPRSYL
jgi:dynein heavy chain 1